MSITAEEQVEVDALFKGFFDILLNKSLATNSNLHKTDYRTEVAGVTKIYIGAPEEEKSSSQYDVIADEVLQEFFGQVEKVDQLNNSDAITASQSMIISKPVNESIESLNTPPLLEVRRSSVDLPSVPHPQAESTDVENNAIEPEKSKTEAEQPMEVVERMMNFAFPEKDADQLEEDFEVDKKFRKSKKKSRAASTSFYVPSPDHDKDDVENNAIEPEKSKTEAEQPMEVVEPVIYEQPEETGSLASMPVLDTLSNSQPVQLLEGIVTNQSGPLINSADGSILTTEDGTPLMLPEGAILQGDLEEAVVASDGLSTTSAAPVPVSSVQLTQSPDGTIIAPQGSMIASDGSILAADGTMLAPPGSVSLTPEPLPQVQLLTQPINPASLAPTEPMPSQPQNLIGLQLPESGQFLFLDPNDFAAQQLLQEAGISLGDNRVLQTLDGQVLQGEDGNPITVNTSKVTASVTSPMKHNNIGAEAENSKVKKKDDTPHYCPYPNCFKFYGRKSSLNEHIKGKHKKGFKCPCGEFHPYRCYVSRCKKKKTLFSD